MKVKTLKRKFADILNRLTAIRDHLTQPYEDRIRTLYHAMKEVILLLFPDSAWIASKKATNQNGHKSDQNGHTENPKRPQTKTATWYSH